MNQESKSRKRKWDLESDQDITPTPEKKQKIKEIVFLTLSEYLKREQKAELTPKDVEFLDLVICRNVLYRSFMDPAQLKFEMTVVALVNSQLEGICSFNLLDENKSLAAIYLLCSKSTGSIRIGQHLLQYVIDQLKKENVKYILVEPSDPSVTFYQKQGFINFYELEESKDIDNQLKQARTLAEEDEQDIETTLDVIKRKSFNMYHQARRNNKKYVTNQHKIDWIRRHFYFHKTMIKIIS